MSEVHDSHLEHLTASLAEGRSVPPEVEEHLDRCPPCRREADELIRLWLGLGELEARPPERLRTRFDDWLDGYRTGRGEADPSARSERRDAPRARGRWLQILGAAAALLAGVALGVGSRSTGGPASGDERLAALEAEVRSLNETVALTLLEKPSAVSRLKGARLSEQLGLTDRRTVDRLGSVVVADPNVNVRLAAVEALEPLAHRPEVRASLVAALRDSSAPLVQVAAADVLLASTDPEIRRSVAEVAEDPAVDERVRRYIATRLGSEA